jgi:hypothetical protein
MLEIDMLLKHSVIAVAAATIFTVGGLASASAQQNCGHMYQRVMEAYHMQSPHYGSMLNRYNARCLSGSSMQPTWNGETRNRYDNRYDNDRRGNDYDRWHRGW